MGAGTSFSPAVHVAHDAPWERRDVLGVHPQKQEGLSWVGASVPAGRITADDLEVSSVRFVAVLDHWLVPGVKAPYSLHFLYK